MADVDAGGGYGNGPRLAAIGDDWPLPFNDDDDDATMPMMMMLHMNLNPALVLPCTRYLACNNSAVDDGGANSMILDYCHGLGGGLGF